MNQEFADMLARLAPGERTERLESMAGLLGLMKDLLGSILMHLNDERAREELLSYFSNSTRASLKNGEADKEHLTPEFLAWARTLDTEEEILAGLEDIEKTGGKELSEFIHELD